MDKCFVIFFSVFIGLSCGLIFVVYQLESKINPQSWQGFALVSGGVLGILASLFIAIIVAAYVSTEMEHRRLYPGRKKF